MNDRTVHDVDGRGELALLGLHEPDPARDALLRARCRAALQERHWRDAVRGDPGWRVAVGMALGPAVVGVMCAVYLFEVISRALVLYRF